MHVKSGAWMIGLALCLTTGVCLGASAVQWQPNLERAKILAAHSNRLVLVHFWGNGCPPCEWMEREVFSRPDVAQAIDRQYVAVRINKDQSPGDASQFGVVAVPTDVIITPQGQVLGSYIGRATVPEFVDRLNQVAQRAMPANAPQYAQGTWAAPTQTAYSPQAPSLGAQPNPAFGPNVPGAAMGQPAQAALPQTPALAAQPGSQYGGQFGIGPGPSPAFAGNPAASPMSVHPDPGLPMASPGPQNAYTLNPQTSPAAAMPAQPGMTPPLPSQQLAQAPGAGNPPLGLDGFCPVSLERTMRLDPQPKWVPGDPRWGFRHEGRTYLFAGPEEQKTFYDNPNRYAPILSGNDVVLQVEQGVQVPGVREFGARWRERVYLFSSRESFEKFQANPIFYEKQILGSQQAAGSPAGTPAQNYGAAMNPAAPAYGYR